MELQAEKSPPPSWLKVVLVGRNPTRTFYRIIILVAVCVVLFRFILLPVRIDGISMLPTYKSNDINFINRLAYVFHEPRRGDVVGIRLRAGPHVMYMKRVVGLPGEIVAFHHGMLFIDGKAILEPYMRAPCDWNTFPEVLGPDQYYVVGDNRTMPAADHTKGKADRKLIMGKALL
jgi:signal peptidase I